MGWKEEGGGIEENGKLLSELDEDLILNTNLLYLLCIVKVIVLSLSAYFLSLSISNGILTYNYIIFHF